MKRNYLPGPRLQLDGIVSLEQGGTSADNVIDARNNLGIVPKSRIGQANGLIPLDQFGKFPASYLEGFVFSTVDLDGPKELITNDVGVYRITNMDSRVNYTVQAEHGTVSIDGDTVTYIAPESHTDGGGFSINSSYYAITILGPVKIPNDPTITSPDTDTVSNADSVVFISSVWSSNYPEDSLALVDWQLSLSFDFTTDLPGSMQVEKLGYTASVRNIPSNSTVYARVRHKGFYGYFSDYSPVRTYTRPVEQKPETPAIVTPSANGTTHEGSTLFVASVFQGTAVGDAIGEALWQTSTNSSFTDSVQEFRKTGAGYNQLQLDTLRDRSYYVRVQYKGTSSWVSNWSNTRLITYIPVEPAQRPTIISPGVNTVVTTNAVTVTATEFVAVAQGDAFQQAEWQVSKLGDFSVLVGSATKTDATYMSFLFNTMLAGDTYYFRVRYMGVSGWYTEWSLVRAVTYGAITKPSIVSPASGTERLKPTVIFYGSTFNLVGLAGTHVSSDWQLSENPAFSSLVAFEAESTTNRTTWTVNNLVYDKTYYVRLRYRSNGNIVSEWSNISMIKIRAGAWDPLKTADIETTISNGSISVSNQGDLLAAGNRAYRITEAGPSLLRAFSNAELFGAGEQYLTSSTQYGYAALVNQTGSTVEIVATAYMPDAIGAVPKSMLAYSKYGYSNGQLIRTEHYVTGNPLIELSTDPAFEATTPVHNFRTMGVHAMGNNHTRVYRMRAATGSTTIYFGQLTKKQQSSFIPVPSEDTYALVQYPEINGQMITVSMQSLAPVTPQNHYSPNGHFMNDDTGSLIQYFHEDAVTPTITKDLEVAGAINNLNVTGSWMNSDMSLFYSLQGTRLLIFTNT